MVKREVSVYQLRTLQRSNQWSNDFGSIRVLEQICLTSNGSAMLVFIEQCVEGVRNVAFF